MAFSAKSLKKLAGNGDAVLWTYKTSDPIAQLKQDDYWDGASATVAIGDAIYAISHAQVPNDAALLFVCQSFAPTGCVKVMSMS